MIIIIMMGIKKRALHTTIESETYKKLMHYGEGFLNAGIEKMIKVAEDKQFNVHEELQKIALEILRRNEIRENPVT